MNRDDAYLRYLAEQGLVERYGAWALADSEKVDRMNLELAVITHNDFSSYFLILADIMDFCRRENIPYGPGRGSVGGCYVAYLIGIHEIDSIEFDLMFERFLGADRVSYPDVDLDFSQRERHRVLEYIQDTYQRGGNVVLQVAAFARAGGRSVIDHVLAARRAAGDISADSTALALRQCLPEGNITGGTKQARELDYWLNVEGHGKRDQFRELAENAGWLDTMLKLDGMFTHLQKHAAGVVILSAEDMEKLPQCSADGESMMTGFDMYDLDELGFLKIDALGLRTLDVIADAHRFLGGSGATRDLMEIWKNHRDDPDPYEMLSEGDTLGIFQMETDGYRHTLREFKPVKFDHIVHLNALYRPGALDFRRESDGKNMVEVFIERRHGHEAAQPPTQRLQNILAETQGIFLFQEQAMKAVVLMAGFTGAEADTLRKGIGKKRRNVIEALEPKFIAGSRENGYTDVEIARVWENIMAASRYSWNKAHAVEYGAITWLTSWFKAEHSGEARCSVVGCPCGFEREGQAAFYGSLLNSFANDSGKAEKQSTVIAEARQRIEIAPPDINTAEDGFTVVGNRIIFGLSGLKGMGPSNRDMLLQERRIPFGSFQDFCLRLPSLPVNLKIALVRAGAFDTLDDRGWLLSTMEKPGKGKKCKTCDGEGYITPELPSGQTGLDGCPECDGSGRIPQVWTVAEHINHNRTLKNPRPVPTEGLSRPSSTELAAGEVDAIGFYVSSDPLADISHALERLPKSNHHGGEIEAIYRKRDKRGDAMATMTLLTPALTRQRVVIFASVWQRFDWIEKGMRVIVRGRRSGDDVLADAIFEPDHVMHFKKIKVSRNGDTPQEEKFDGNIETVKALESAGYTVRLL